jgi:predicted Zn-dependent protease
MNTARIQQLLAFVQEEPNEPFNVYALALEYLNDTPAESLRYFTQLLDNHPDYLPTYYHAAQLCADLGDDDRARSLYEQGIALSQKQGNAKTERELRSALQNLE